MKFKDKIAWLFGSYLIQETDNPYSYTCRRCGQYFITIGSFEYPFHNEIVPPDEDSVVDKKCKCVRLYKRRFWKNYY